MKLKKSGRLLDEESVGKRSVKEKTTKEPSSYVDFKKRYRFTRYLTRKQIQTIDDYVRTHMDDARWIRDPTAAFKKDQAVEPWIFSTMDYLSGEHRTNEADFVHVIYLACSFMSMEPALNEYVHQFEKGIKHARKLLPKYEAVNRDIQTGLAADPDAIQFLTGLKLREYRTLCHYLDRAYKRLTQVFGPSKSKKIRHTVKLYIPEYSLELELKWWRMRSVMLYMLLSSLFAAILTSDYRVPERALTQIGFFLVFWRIETGDPYDVGVRMRARWHLVDKWIKKLLDKVGNQIRIYQFAENRMSMDFSKVSFDPVRGRLVFPISKVFNVKRALYKKLR